jgi:hypothetical protein
MPNIMKFWDYDKNKLDPKDLKPGSAKDVYWICPKGHSDFRRINSFINHGGKCSYCEGTKLCGENCLSTTHPKLCKEWSSLNILGPENYSKGTAKKVYWICPRGHPDYLAIINCRTGHESGCPKCNASKGEIMIEKILVKNNINYTCQKPIKCGTKILKFDFYLIDFNIAIEFDDYNIFNC